jgi:hypothetical protein
VLQLETGEDDRLVCQRLDFTVTMLDGDVVDERTGIGARKHQADLTDDAVEDLLGLLNQLVGVDRQGRDVLVLDKRLAFCAGVSLKKPYA